jgi:hypothetical protein
MDIVQRYSSQLTSLRTLTVFGDPWDVACDQLEFPQPVCVRVVIRDTMENWQRGQWPMFRAIPVVVATYASWHRRSVRIIYADNPSWSIVDAVGMVNDIVSDGGTPVGCVDVVYRGAALSTTDVVANSIRTSFGERIVDGRFPPVTVHSSDVNGDARLLTAAVLAGVLFAAVVASISAE